MIEELQELERDIYHLELRLRAVGDLYKDVEAPAYGQAKAKYLYDLAAEKIRLFEEGKADPEKKLTDQMREAYAIKACKESLEEMSNTRTAFEASKEVLRALQSELSGKQTRVGLFKADWGLAGRQDYHNQPPEEPNWQERNYSANEPDTLKEYEHQLEDDNNEPGDIDF